MSRKRDIRYKVWYQTGEKTRIGTIPLDKFDLVASLVDALDDEIIGPGHAITITRTK